MSVQFLYSAQGAWDSPDVRMQFPAGEQHVVEGRSVEMGGLDQPIDEDANLIPTAVVVRGTDANDYISAAMWVDLQSQRGWIVDLIVPYLPGARQDRGRPFGAKVYAKLINMVGANKVITFDAHSPVMPGLIDNVHEIEPWLVVPDALETFGVKYDGIIIPDKGAVERSTALARALEVPTYQASKVRDFPTGKLTGFECEPLPQNGKFLIADDICDGGGTFMGLVAATGLPPERVDLWVSHGVFSGTDEKMQALRSKFGRIFTTNSHPNHDRDAVGAEVVDVVRMLFELGKFNLDHTDLVFV